MMIVGLIFTGCRIGCKGDGKCKRGDAGDAVSWCGDVSCKVNKSLNSKCDC